MKKVLALLFALCMIFALSATAFADVDLSDASVTIICPYGAGGGTGFDDGAQCELHIS